MKKIKICITCINGFLTYDFVESLKNQKDFESYLIGIDISDGTKGAILCDKFYRVSSPKKEKNYLNDIKKIYLKEKFDVIIPLSDIENYILLKNKDFFEDLKIKFKMPFNNYSTASLFYNKENFLEYCNKNKFKTGKYTIVSSYAKVIEFVKKYKSKKYILKPVRGSGTKNVFLINDKVKKKIKILESRDCDEVNFKILKKLNIFKNNEEFILMPYIDGNIYDIDCIAKNGRIKEFCIRLREIKNRFMFYSTGHRIVRDNKIKKLIKNFVSKLKLDGICDFDVIKKRNKIYLLEASCRFSGSVGVCTSSGMNFPAQIIRYLMNMKKKNYKLKYNESFRSFLVFKKIKDTKKNILLNDYIPHYSKQLKY